MRLVDTCGWIEWLTSAPLAVRFAPHLKDAQRLVVPTVVQYELYRWICRERDEALGLEIIGLTQQGRVVPLTTPLALLAADLAAEHKLAFADAVVYATARQENCEVVTSDRHFAHLPGVIFLGKRTAHG